MFLFLFTLGFFLLLKFIKALHFYSVLLLMLARETRIFRPNLHSTPHHISSHSQHFYRNNAMLNSFFNFSFFKCSLHFQNRKKTQLSLILIFCYLFFVGELVITRIFFQHLLSYIHFFFLTIYINIFLVVHFLAKYWSSTPLVLPQYSVVRLLR